MDIEISVIVSKQLSVRNSRQYVLARRVGLSSICASKSEEVDNTLNMSGRPADNKPANNNPGDHPVMARTVH